MTQPHSEISEWKQKSDASIIPLIIINTCHILIMAKIPNYEQLLYTKY